MFVTVSGLKKKRKSRGDFKLRYRKTFAALLEEVVSSFVASRVASSREDHHC